MGRRRHHTFFDLDRPMVFAHRGGGALAPENTLAAFDQAVTLGVDGLELDVHQSKDGHLVVCHDPTVDRTTDGSGSIADLTLPQLRELDAGYAFTPDGGETFPFRGRDVRIPTLEQVLRRYEGVRLSVELKGDDVASARLALDASEDAGTLERMCLGSFGRLPVRWVRAQGASVATWATQSEVVRFLLLHSLHLRQPGPRAHAFAVPERAGRRTVVTPRLVQTLAKHGTPVHVWTVNEADDMRRLLDWGVRGLVTDRPDVALDVVAGS